MAQPTDIDAPLRWPHFDGLDRKDVNVSIRLPTWQLVNADIVAEKLSITRSEVIRMCLERGLDQIDTDLRIAEQRVAIIVALFTKLGKQQRLAELMQAARDMGADERELIAALFTVRRKR